MLIGVLFIISSCSIDDDERVQFHMEFIPVVGVDVPEYFVRGETYPITVSYNRPTDCYYFDGFYYEPDGNVRVVAVQSIVIEDSNCEPLDTLVAEEASFDFICSPLYSNQSYLFKFYRSVDEEGNQLFLEVEVPVMEE